MFISHVVIQSGFFDALGALFARYFFIMLDLFAASLWARIKAELRPDLSTEIFFSVFAHLLHL
jgi:hypothetical protein